ncbi:MAG TPA: TatD family hydrolase [Planctomycetota bacterium]
MLTDSHAHLDDPAFAADLPDVLRRAREAGVGRIVTIGTSLASSRKAREIAEREPDVWFSPGIHPHEADAPGDVDALRELAGHPRAVAVGETGLDYFKNYSAVPNQKALFVRQLEIAAEAGKPVSIHCRDAHGDCLAILRAHAPLRGVIHCFTGDAAAVEGYLSLNFFLSIAGPVTYPKAQALREAVRAIPLENLLVETDCPLLTPQPKRGTRNEPAYVAYTAAEVAAVQERPVEEVRAATTANAARLFGFGT